MWVFPDTSVLDYGYADMDTLFLLGPYVLIFLVPAITMRSFAEEKKAGTIELLLTKPVDDWDIIMGKFLANFSWSCLPWYRPCCIIFRFQRWEIHLATLILRVLSDPI
jgi:ABC-type transport system involved in cytochrome c biogenesis permease component